MSLSQTVHDLFGTTQRDFEVDFSALPESVPEMTVGQTLTVANTTTGIPLTSNQAFTQPTAMTALSSVAAAQKEGFATIRCVKNGFIVEPCGAHGDDDVYVCKNLKQIVAILTEMRLSGR